MTSQDGLSFLGRSCPDGFRISMLTLQPADAITCCLADWTGRLIVVERGVLELECGGGARTRFPAGAVVGFSSVRPRRIRNAGDTVLVVSVLSPGDSDEESAQDASHQ